jgi:hypothetical protein
MLRDVREAAIAVQEAWGEVVKALRPSQDPMKAAKALKLAGLRVTQLGIKFEDYINESRRRAQANAQSPRQRLDNKTEL